MPWQEVQFTVALAFQAMVAAVAPESAALPPWHQVAEQESVGPTTEVAGTEPFVEASVPQATATVPLAWVVSLAAGIGPWHSVQARPAERSVGVRWRRCAPTPREVVSALPEASTAVALKPGAEVALVLATAAPAWPESTPWQAVQPLAGFWMVPSTWVAAVTVVAVVPVWQTTQFVLAGWCVAMPAGGSPWQAVQPSLPEVAQEMAVALWLPPGKLPWQ